MRERWGARHTEGAYAWIGICRDGSRGVEEECVCPLQRKESFWQRFINARSTAARSTAARRRESLEKVKEKRKCVTKRIVH